MIWIVAIIAVLWIGAGVVTAKALGRLKELGWPFGDEEDR